MIETLEILQNAMNQNIAFKIEWKLDKKVT